MLKNIIISIFVLSTITSEGNFIVTSFTNSSYISSYNINNSYCQATKVDYKVKKIYEELTNSEFIDHGKNSFIYLYKDCDVRRLRIVYYTDTSPPIYYLWISEKINEDFQG